METWNRPTADRRDREGDNDGKTGKGLVKGHV